LVQVVGVLFDGDVIKRDAHESGCGWWVVSLVFVD
jgi:hypothetical protein